MKTTTSYICTVIFLLVSFIGFAQSKQIPSSLMMEDLKGKKVNLKEYIAKKDKVTVISFWATWCKPCKEELDNIASDYYDDWVDEYDIAFGIDLTLTGTSGTANIGIDTGSGIVNYLATFNTDLATTVQDWIALHGATLGALGVNVLYNGGSPLNANGNETIRFCASESACNSVVITTLTGDLSGTRINPFTGVNVAAGDHCLIPYSGKAYNGQRLLHTMRVNFDISTGNQVQSAALTLRRFADDSIIGSSIKVDRDVDVPGNQFVFETYTDGATDPFVLGGFYFALENDSGNSLTFETKAGILIQTIFQRPTSFSS